MNWEHLLKVYEDMGVENIIPIAHTRIHPHVKVLIDEKGNFIGATLNGEDRFTIPCTIESESRTNGNNPHPIHDNMQYLSADYNKEKHDRYMEQLTTYISKVDDKLAKAVYFFTRKNCIRECLKDFFKKIPLPEDKTVVCFVMAYQSDLRKASISGDYEKYCLHLLRSGDGQNMQWKDYYLHSLQPNGICSITGNEGFIPKTYPKGIRFAGDSAKLFIASPSNILLAEMPTLAPSYVVSQKILHTLQCLCYEGSQWANQVMRDNLDILPYLELTGEEKRAVKNYFNNL
jgi:hypothetical protein